MAVLDREPYGFVDQVTKSNPADGLTRPGWVSAAQRMVLELEEAIWISRVSSGPPVAIAQRQRSVVPAGPQILKFSGQRPNS